MDIEGYLKAMPKAEIHVHLEGSMRPEILLQLATKNDVDLPGKTVETIQQWYVFRDFSHFVEIYITICRTLQKPEDFTLIAYDLGKTLAEQNVRYAEVTTTPGLHIYGNGLDFRTWLESINAGRQQAKDEFGIEMRWIMDLARNLDSERAEELVALIASDYARDNGVVALGLGGAEVGFPPEMFEAAFAQARERGLPGNPHAGETVGPVSIWGALRSLKATRIGHGVRAIEDPELVTYLVEHQIPLEVCPTSNLCLGVFPSYEAHSLKQLVEAGVVVTINSDDPPMFNTTINDEYLHVFKDCGLTLPQIEKATLEAVRVSYLPDKRKRELVDDFQTTFNRLRGEFGIDPASSQQSPGWIEDFWAGILSREPERIRAAFQQLQDAEERSGTIQHLQRMVSEDGWAEPQRVSAQRALDALRPIIDV
ncbi:MAG: adenosine deaminase [Chloroflexi bacterium]|nr:adenosine deaminase [Chloroflexota bacterium]